MLFIISILALWGGVEATASAQSTTTAEAEKTYYVKFEKSEEWFAGDETYIIPEKDGNPDTDKNNFIYPTYVPMINLKAPLTGTSVTKGGSWAKIPGLEDKKYKVKYIETVDGKDKISKCYATVDVGLIRNGANLENVKNIMKDAHTFQQILEDMIRYNEEITESDNLQMGTWDKMRKEISDKIYTYLQIESKHIIDVSLFEQGQDKLGKAVCYFISGCLDLGMNGIIFDNEALNVYTYCLLIAHKDKVSFCNGVKEYRKENKLILLDKEENNVDPQTNLSDLNQATLHSKYLLALDVIKVGDVS